MKRCCRLPASHRLITPGLEDPGRIVVVAESKPNEWR